MTLLSFQTWKTDSKELRVTLGTFVICWGTEQVTLEAFSSSSISSSGQYDTLPYMTGKIVKNSRCNSELWLDHKELVTILMPINIFTL